MAGDGVGFSSSFLSNGFTSFLGAAAGAELAFDKDVADAVFSSFLGSCCAILLITGVGAFFLAASASAFSF